MSLGTLYVVNVLCSDNRIIGHATSVFILGKFSFLDKQVRSFVLFSKLGISQA